MESYQNRKIIIATHVLVTGPAQDLRDYFIKKGIKKLLFIGHPLLYEQRLNGSGYEVYTGSTKIKSNYKKIKKIPNIIAYLISYFSNIFWAITESFTWDLYIGYNNLNALSGIFLKRFGFVKKTIYYVIDYNPKRFDNAVMNTMYHFIDQICVRYCDETWNLSETMSEARKNYYGFINKKQKEVKMGVWIDRIKVLDFDKIDKETLVFVGHILEKQGLHHVLNAIPLITQKIDKFNFLVIGGGDYLETLKQQAKKMHIENCVKFTGYIKEHEDIENILLQCGVAIALYERYVNKELSFTYFTDPGKIKLYLACGLPVILTDVPQNAYELEEKMCAIVIHDTNPVEIANAIFSLMKDTTKLKTYRGNAIAYARQFDWNIIFEQNLVRVLH